MARLFNAYLRRRGLLAAIAPIAALLAVAPAASAESASSSSGTLSASVPAPVVTGVPSTYTITVTNTTSRPMASVVAGAQLPSGMTLKGVGVECGRTNRPVVQNTAFWCGFPDLAPGASASATVTLLASTATTYDIPFTMSATQPLPGVPGASTVAQDAVTLPVNVQPGPTDIQVTGSASTGSPVVGDVFDYRFQVKNNGPQAAYGVTFDDTLPTAILLGSDLTTDNGVCSPNYATGAVHCDIGTLGVGQQSNIVFSAQPTAPGAFGDTASIAMLGMDTKPANNNSTVTVQPK
jgi:uncharacterized repeat protein (TIGR01451 family)